LVRREVFLGSVILVAALMASARAGAPTAVINASPVSGPAPLAVQFDGSSSSSDVVSFLWDFGDGGASTAQTISYTYTASGTFNAQLTVTNAQGLQNIAQVAITVTGNYAGPITPDMNFRMALITSSFNLNHATPNQDRFQMLAVFNTVDLPISLNGLVASFSINNIYTISGVLDSFNVFQTPTADKPSFQIYVNLKLQQVQIFLSAADLSAALAASGAGDIDASKLSVPVTFSLSIGAQTYMLTENFRYNSKAGGSGKGAFNLASQTGGINEGFFVISNASATENVSGTGYYFTFSTLLSRSMAKLVSAPPPGGSCVLTFNDAPSVTILFDSLILRDNKLTYLQPSRDQGGMYQLSIEPLARRMTISTWDLPSFSDLGGTGLPLPGQRFKDFNFTLRLSIDQADGTTLQAVTATRLQRQNIDATFWQTGRKIRP
jgi:PKD repeat protein